MDFGLDAAEAPPSIPTRTRFNTTTANPRRRSQQLSSSPADRLSLPPVASPEVISNLITSLSGISKPADDYFEGTQSTPSATIPGPTLSLPTSPGGGSRAASTGSFGIDYGAFSKPSDLGVDPVSLDDLAASSPVIRTSKPTTGFSPLKNPKSPSRASSRDNLRSFIRSSSTSSRPSSHESRNDDSHSIGNLSIERNPAAPEHELQHRRSHDSWGKKTNRNSKGLMYMSSKERLREREEWKRSMDGSLHRSSYGNLNGGGVSLNGASSSHSATKTDPFLAETAISEEPTPEKAMDHPRPIPMRDSSLRRTSQKRISARRSNHSDVTKEGIPETSEPTVRKRASSRKPARLDLEISAAGRSFLLDPGESAPTPTTQHFLETIRDDYLAFDNHTADGDDDGAPFPAVSQNRRRSTQSIDLRNRRKSANSSPALGDDGRPRRSSSRLKRLSRPASPVSEVKSPGVQSEGGVPLERLDSVDSIDDAVDSYLCSPRLTQKIKHPQTGRVICFSEVGDSEGSAVFCCVGMGLTRYITAFYDELALTLKLRLITPDRPGVGESEPYPDGSTTPLSWPDDVYAICQALKITKFSILAHSAGAIYALATALRMPQHIRGRIHLLAPWIPPSQMNVFGGSQALPPTHATPTSQRILRALPTPMLKIANSSFMSATSSSITTSLPKNARRKRKSNGNRDSTPAVKGNLTPTMDKENIQNGDYGRDIKGGLKNGQTVKTQSGAGNLTISNPVHDETRASGVIGSAEGDAMADQERQSTYDIRLTHAIWALATTGANPAVDLLVCLERRHTIGFRYVDINRPVVIHHGSRDTRVPVDNVRWLGKSMRRCEVRVLEDEGHGLMASAGVMGSVLMEISKEWEDWMRVTGADGRKEKERGRKGTLIR